MKCFGRMGSSGGYLTIKKMPLLCNLMQQHCSQPHTRKQHSLSQQQLQKQREQQGQQKQKVLRLQVPPQTASAAQEPQQQQEVTNNVEQQQRQQQWWELLPTSMNALVWSQGVQGVRDVSQFVGLGLAYVVTGNLAASYAAAVVNQVLMSWLQRRGIQRTRQRSIELAKGMAELNRQLRLRAQKQRQKQQEKALTAAAATAGAEEEQQQAAVTVHAATAPVVSVDTERPLAGQGVALEGPGSRVGSAAAAAVATSSSVAMGTDDGRWSGADVDLRVDGELSELELGPQGPGGMTGKLEETIAALDSLLGQMGEDPPPSGA